jgi:hypothetical protein
VWAAADTSSRFVYNCRCLLRHTITAIEIAQAMTPETVVDYPKLFVWITALCFSLAVWIGLYLAVG